MNNISIKGLVFSAILYLLIAFLAFMVLSPIFLGYMGESCSNDNLSNCTDSMFNAVFYMGFVVEVIATFAAYKVLLSYAEPHIKVNTIAFSVLWLLLGIDTENVVNSIINLIPSIGLIVFMYYSAIKASDISEKVESDNENAEDI